MKLTEVYVALGGNLGQPHITLPKALQLIAEIPGVHNLTASHFYKTTPVSSIPQPDYLNAVCRFLTLLSARELLHHLQHIEHILGKKPKSKNAPRIIDLDILFFGPEIHEDPDLQIPHPHWKERLFVLVPLSDLTTDIVIPDRHSPNGIQHIHIPHLIALLQE
jgi:2-amino-4-hydroxy-6-hydroxymethyldihydropteridine diphosphokinase